MQSDAADIIAEKDALIQELRETNEVRSPRTAGMPFRQRLPLTQRVLTAWQILDTKVQKLEQLVRLKDAKIAALLTKLQL